MTDPCPQTIPYHELLARFAPETPPILVFRPAMPTFRIVEMRTVEVYFPVWITASMLEKLCQRLRTRFPRYDLAVVLVTDIPCDRLFGEWAAQAPEGTP